MAGVLLPAPRFRCASRIFNGSVGRPWVRSRVVAEDEVLQSRADRPVIRTGATVTHPVQPWTPAIHALLDYLEQAGFPYSPRVLGVADDTEILSYIEGDSGPEGWARVVDEQGLRAAARLLRAYHDVVAEWKPDHDPVWFTGQVGTGTNGEIVCHGDFGPWNIVWHGTTPVGLLDWEYANLAPPRQDIAYALEYMAPFRDDETCIEWLRYPQPPDRRRRLELFAKTYGLTSTDGLLDEVIAVQQAGIDTVARMAADGHQRQVAMVQAGELDHLKARLTWTEQHRHLFT